MPFMLIDGNSVGYAAQYATKLVVDGMEVQAIYNSLHTLKKLKAEYPDYVMLILWDGRAQFRFDALPDYKSDRDDTHHKEVNRTAYSIQAPVLRKMVGHLGFTQVVAPNFEADDLAGYFTTKFNDKTIELITGDKDWLQLITPKVSWHDPRYSPGTFCNWRGFRDFTNYETTAKFLEGKALIGDKSDNISGVGGIGPVASEGIMKNFGSVAGLLKWYKIAGPLDKKNVPQDLSRVRGKVNKFCESEDAQKIFKRNMGIMNLSNSTILEQVKSNIQIDKGKKDMKAFHDMCAELSFLSITRNIEKWGNIT